MPTSRPPMRQQQGPYAIQRASRAAPVPRSRQQPPSNPHYSGHSAGIHPEDRPDFYSDDLEEDDSYYVTNPYTHHTSSRRYAQPQQPQVIQQGNRRLVIHNEPLPARKVHWLVYVGIAIFVMVMGYFLVTMLGVWWQNKQDDWAYGMPRTYQTDANVGHGTSQQPMSHFVAVNLDGEIKVIELPGDDSSKAKIYDITTLPAGSGAVPVTLKFQDMNADGKPDMLITIGDANSQQFTVFLFNNGSQFMSKL